MKKVTAFITLALCCTAVLQAQKTRFGVAAGVSLANVQVKSDGESDNGDMRTGFTGGFLADIPLSKQIYFQPGLNWVQKGTQQEETDMGDTYKAKLNLNYLEVPLNFVYKVNQKKGNFFFGLGPTLAYGISGKAIVEFNGDEESDDIHFGSSEDDDLKPFEIGGNILAGYEFNNGMFLSANYNRTFTNPVIDGDSDNKLTNSYFGIKLGYFFKSAK